MDILVLSPYPTRLIPVDFFGDRQGRIFYSDQLDEDHIPDVEWIISYGYRHILKRNFLNKFPGNIINIHIGLLPWNRGSDPNFWSWFEDTPKGFSIHQIDKGMDTGAIYYQAEMKFSMDKYNTLATTYQALHEAAIESLMVVWSDIRDGKIKPVEQAGIGTSHRAADKQQFFQLLSAGYDTPVIEVATWGKLYRARQKQ